jgi:very-short-patch-repair endonuclease/Zn ribbon nucleic-acid-binding protein
MRWRLVMTHIIINDQRLINITKAGRSNIYTLANNTTISSKDFITIGAECPSCFTIKPLKKLHNYNLKKVSECNRCKCLGLKNPFYGKKHNNKTKKKISKKNKNRLVGSKNPMYGVSLLEHWINKYGRDIADKKNKEYLNKLSDIFSGDKNPFYGKRHTTKTRQIIKEKNIKYRNNLSIQDKIKISKRLSESQKKLYQKNPEDYISKRSKAGKITATKPHKYKINKIEKIVADKLKELGLNFEYSIILNCYQFDFGCKKHKILLEVQGDYWHGNPRIYKKRELNDTQKKNSQRDKEKIKFVKKHQMKLYYIWESDIKSNNFKVLEDIKNEIYSRTNYKN